MFRRAFDASRYEELQRSINVFRMQNAIMIDQPDSYSADEYSDTPTRGSCRLVG